MVMGKVESGGLVKGMSLTLMPNKVFRQMSTVLDIGWFDIHEKHVHSILAKQEFVCVHVCLAVQKDKMVV